MRKYEASLMATVLCTCIGAASMLGAVRAGAEEVGAESEEQLPIENLFVVVTAQKRTEDLQETPIAITALSRSDIENRGVSSLVDLHVAVPGVNGYEAPSSRGNIAFNIRGISSGNPNSVSADPANALYVDGVYVGKAVGNGVDALDLERIEVLRGPQGTLYGRNSTGGAINLITRKPAAELGLDVKVAAGDYGYRALSARVDAPLADQFNLALSGYNRERDPLYENTRADGAGFESLNRQGVRLAAFFDATESFAIDYAFSLDELNENAQALDVVGFNPAGAGVLGASGFPGRVDIRSTNRVDAVARLQAFLPFLGPAFATPQVQQLNQWMTDYQAFAAQQLSGLASRSKWAGSDVDQESDNSVTGHTLTLTLDAEDLGALGNVEFKSTTARREVENRNEGDLDGMDNSILMGPGGQHTGIVHDLVLQTIGGLFLDAVSPDIPAAVEFGVAQAMVDAIVANGSAPVFNNFATIDYEQFSQELQVVGTNRPLEYALGIYYHEDEAAFRNNRAAVFPIASSETSSHDNATESVAGYGQFTWTPNGDSAWSHTLGLRYTLERKEVEYLWRSSAHPFGFFGPFFAGQSVASTYVDNARAEEQAPVAGVFGRSFDQDFSNLTGKLGTQYRMADSLNLFATYARGYRSGGFNGDFFDSVNDTADAFDEEIIDSYEVGFKSEFWDERARLNASAFMYTYDNLQVSQLLPAPNGTVTSSITNAGSAKREGFEIELVVAPRDTLLVTLAYTGVAGDFEEFPPVVASPLDGGAMLVTDGLAQRGTVPDGQMTFAIDWVFARGRLGELRLSANGIWQDEMTPISLNTGNYDTNGNRLPDTPVAFRQLTSDERTIINLRLACDGVFGYSNVSVAAWVRNLTDDDHRNFSFNYGESLGLSVAQFGEPRVWGADLTWEI